MGRTGGPSGKLFLFSSLLHLSFSGFKRQILEFRARWRRRRRRFNFTLPRLVFYGPLEIGDLSGPTESRMHGILSDTWWGNQILNVECDRRRRKRRSEVKVETLVSSSRVTGDFFSSSEESGYIVSHTNSGPSSWKSSAIRKTVVYEYYACDLNQSGNLIPVTRHFRAEARAGLLCNLSLVFFRAPKISSEPVVSKLFFLLLYSGAW